MHEDAPAGAAAGRAPDSPSDPRPDPHRLAWLRLGHAPGVPPSLVVALRRHEPDTAALGAALARLLEEGSRGDGRGGGRGGGADAAPSPDDPLAPLSAEAVRALRSRAARRAVDAALDWEAGGPGRHLLTPGDGRYPESVACLDDAPAALALRGDPAALDLPGLAIVGSRRATRLGLEHAREYAGAFARRGVSIVSGLAHGIDAAAHEAALAAGGTTLAVVATGPDRTYPARHAHLAARIADAGGAVLSEHPIGFVPRPYHFPHRNRLIAALALGTLIVEAADPSGTLGTAAHANAQSRAVMALPGLPGDPASAGCHRLVREGAATLVAGPADVAATLAAHVRMLLDADAREAELRRRLAARPPARAVAAGAAHADEVARLDRALRDGPPARRRVSGGRVPGGRISGEGLAGGRAGRDLPPDGLDADARLVHGALDADGPDAGALAARTGLGVARVAAALARLEAAGVAARDGVGGYVRCRPTRGSTPRPLST